jgi:hypothetical protein
MTYDYTGKKILSIKSYELMIQQEVDRVKNLSIIDRTKQKWAGLHQRPANLLWVEDSVIHLKNIGPAKAKKLEEQNVPTVRVLMSKNANDLVNLSVSTGISRKILTDCVAQCAEAQQGATPYPIPFDWVEGQANPYLNRYGVSWKDEIKKVNRSGLPLVRCVTDLVEHIEKHTKAAYAGTEYKDNYYWAHDALKQMCDPACEAWMKQKGYWDHWITPVLGCNDVVSCFCAEKNTTLTSKRYARRPVGNQPELMPLDASLNWDIDCALNMHVLLTADLPNDHPDKFRKDTPLRISQAITKLCHPVTGVVPSSKRIVQDCNRILTSAVAIVEAGGKIVPGLVNRNGHRHKPETDGRRYHPRKRDQVIKTMDEFGIFKSVQRIALASIESEAQKFNNRSH